MSRDKLPNMRIRLTFQARVLLGIVLLSVCMFYQQHISLKSEDMLDANVNNANSVAASINGGLATVKTKTRSVKDPSIRNKSGSTDSHPENQPNVSWDNGSLTNIQSKLMPQSRLPVRNHTCSVNGQTVTFPMVPQFIIAGAQKSGTTALFEFLNQHPDIQGSLASEAHFFDWYYPRDNISRTEWLAAKQLPDPLPTNDLQCAIQQSYSEHFNVTSIDKLYFEKSPSYLFVTGTPEAIASTCFWNPKIVVILRNPIDRAISHFRMRARIHHKTFEDFVLEEVQHLKRIGLSHAPLPTEDYYPNDPAFAIPILSKKISEDLHWKHYRKMFADNYLQRGMYITQLQRWLPYFPLAHGNDDEGSMMVMNYEQFKQQPEQVFGRLLQFIGAAPFVPAEGFGTIYNSKAYRGHRMQAETRRYLKAFFRPYNELLADTLKEEWRGVWD